MWVPSYHLLICSKILHENNSLQTKVVGQTPDSLGPATAIFLVETSMIHLPWPFRLNFLRCNINNLVKSWRVRHAEPLFWIVTVNNKKKSCLEEKSSKIMTWLDCKRSSERDTKNVLDNVKKSLQMLRAIKAAGKNQRTYNVFFYQFTLIIF